MTYRYFLLKPSLYLIRKRVCFLFISFRVKVCSKIVFSTYCHKMGSEVNVTKVKVAKIRDAIKVKGKGP